MRGDGLDIGLGCRIVRLPHYEDERGHLTPFFQDSDEELVMAYTSTTFAGKARDDDQWHIHKYQTDRFACIHGTVTFALSDGVTSKHVVLRPEPCPMMLYIPPGVYHCFKSAVMTSIIINFPTCKFNPDDEGRVLFSDLDAEHPW